MVIMILIIYMVPMFKINIKILITYTFVNLPMIMFKMIRMEISDLRNLVKKSSSF